MRRAAFLPVLIASVAVTLAACGGGEATGPEAQEAEVKGTVEDPCDCFKEGITEAQRLYCRDAKRDTQFLDQLRRCGTGEVGGVPAVENMPLDGQYTMNPEQSTIEWLGRKAGMKEKGTVPVRVCTFSVRDGQLLDGTLVVEMSGIKATSQEGQAARELGQHLRSEDFFHVAEFPTAAYTITSSRADGRGNLQLMGKLNVKGITKEVEAVLRFASANPVVASVNFEFDRADFDVRFGSGSFFDDLGDNLIADEVSMRMALVEDVTKRKR